MNDRNSVSGKAHSCARLRIARESCHPFHLKVATPERAVAVPDNNLHVVLRGETLYGIAWRHGLDYWEVAAANGIVPPYLIKPGQRLRLAAPAPSDDMGDDREPETASQRKTPVRPPRSAAAPALRPEPEPDQPVDVPANPVARDALQSVPAGRGFQSGDRRWRASDEPARGFDADTGCVEYELEHGSRVGAATGGVVVYAGSGLGAMRIW